MELSFKRLSIEGACGAHFIDGNSVSLLYKGRDSFDAIFNAIDDAREIICLQFYIFRNDETGTEVANRLKKKAAEGVRVYLLYDHFGSIGTPLNFWKDLRASGINVRASRPFKWGDPFYYAHRDHRKLIIIDGLKAFTGGLNIANEYRGFHIKIKRTGWRDTGIMLEVHIALELSKTFVKTWTAWGGGQIKDSNGSIISSEGSGGLPVIPIFASSSKGRRMMRKLLYYSIKQAQKSILLTTAYFTPSRRLVDSLEDAIRKGVSVKLLLPGISDVPAAHYAGRAFFKRLLRSGVKIYNYQGEVLHAKSYVFDSCWSIVGSANLDFQSLRWNDEGNVGILSHEFGSQMTSVFEEDLQHSIEITAQDWENRPLCDRIKERFFVLFRRRL